VPYDFAKERVLKAVRGSFGIMSEIARRLEDCDWHTAEKYVNKWAETRQAYADEDERALDFTEGQMLAAIKSGDGPMIRFHLATKGKRRGYVTREEVSGPDGGAVTYKIEYVNDWREINTPADAAPGAAGGNASSGAI
jgi:hypothetical protein